MNTALLSLDRPSAFSAAPIHFTIASRDARPLCADTDVFAQLAAFCTRVLLLGGRSPIDQPSLARVLLAAYAADALEALGDDAALEVSERFDLATRLMRDVLQMESAEAERHAAVLVSPAGAASPRLGEIMRRGAAAFAQWQEESAEFVPDDFRELVAACAARPAIR
ncbi:MAG: hypothetical protein ABMA13_21595 [Chthoniobacteraceae bacterium]